MRVKICGITNLDDAIAAIDAGADALGFVFYEKSPRYIDPKEAAKISKALPPFIERVGLFVNVSADFVNRVCKETKMSLAQIHFEAKDSFYDGLDVKYLKVVRAKSKEDVKKDQNRYRLIDAFVESYGGEGKRVDLDWFRDIDCSKIILAGGLNLKNIQSIKKYDFYATDVSSGVEKSKGIKDHEKIRSFIEAVKDIS